MKKVALFACVAAVVASPAFAADKPKKDTQIFVEKARKIVQGERQITAVRTDGQKTAFVTIAKDGSVKGTVDGKPVNVVFQED